MSEESKPNYLIRLQNKWGLTSIWQVVLVLIVFALTGSTIVAVKKLILSYIDPSIQIPKWVQTTFYLLFMLPAYQVLLLAYGYVFGVFDFFWEKEKKLIRRVKNIFIKDRNENGQAKKGATIQRGKEKTK